MKIDPWRKSVGDLYQMTPDLKVYTLRLSDDDELCPGLLCDAAWTSAAETKTHFWWDSRYEKKPRIIKGSLLGYLKLPLKECDPMNPFWAVGRMEFMEKWVKIHGENPYE